MLRGTLSSASLSCSNDPSEFNCRELKLNPGGAGVRGVPAPRNVGFFCFNQHTNNKHKLNIITLVEYSVILFL